MSFLKGPGFVHDLSGASPATVQAALAADPAGARAALLDPDGSYPVDSLSLGTSGGVELVAGSLSRNTAGDLIVHNDNDTGDNLNPILDARSVLRFSKSISAASMNGDGLSTFYYSIKVGQVLLPADWATIGVLLDIQVKLRAGWSAGNKPDSGVWLSFCAAGTTPTGSNGVMVKFATGVSSESRELWLKPALSASSSNWEMGNGFPAAVKGALVIKESGGTVTVDDEGVDADDVIYFPNPDAVTGVSGEPQVIDIFILSIDDSGTVAANLYVSGMISMCKE